MMALRIAQSALDHGITEDDITHAMLNWTYRVEEFDEPRVTSGGRPDLFIGPLRDRSNLLEIMAVITPPDDIFVFHAMIARKKHIDTARGSTG